MNVGACYAAGGLLCDLYFEARNVNAESGFVSKVFKPSTPPASVIEGPLLERGLSSFVNRAFLGPSFAAEQGFQSELCKRLQGSVFADLLLKKELEIGGLSSYE